VSDVGDRDDGSPESWARLVSKLTHEIRGPVSTVRGLVGTTLAHFDRLSDEERKEFLGLIRHEADRLERTVEQVAFALKLDAGSMRFDIRPHDLSEIVRDAAQAAEGPDRSVRVDAPAHVEAPVDRAQIGMVIRQLIDNAMAYSPPDAPVEVHLREAGADACIDVVDRGPGIPTDKREAVFERFSDWRPVGYEDRPGAGLGLFICRAVARAHGGDASIADGSDGGTMLTVRLPMEG
jgi:signal transduction histidine kinase